MKTKKVIHYIVGLIMLASITVSCTDLTEDVYDIITKENYYNTKDDVIRAYVRPFEHAFWNILPMYELQESTADQQATYNREGWWYDGGFYQKLHYHTWDLDHDAMTKGWTANFQGVMQCCSAIDDLSELNPARFNMKQEEMDGMIAGLRTLRAHFYINLLDLYRNVPLAVSADPEKNSTGQVTPQETFTFIETELLEVIDQLPLKADYGGNREKQGQWTQGGAAALLVKLYLNAEKWIGTPKYTECATYAQAIIDGTYGAYEIASRWDEPFDWNNETSDEVIFGFTASKTRAHWHMGANDQFMYWWSLPANFGNYFGFTEWSQGANPKYALQPSRDVDGNLYDFELGMPVARFQDYPEDYRLKKYKNLPHNGQREGMFLYGYVEYQEDGANVREKSPNGYVYYIRDQVGMFKGATPGAIISNKESSMNNADHNSGWHPIKYPIYRDGDPGAMEADYTLIRLAEVYYSLAECKFRAGDTDEAGTLLNEVRKRNYPEEFHDDYLYQPEGDVELTQKELLAEWGREFLAEGRRRTDLCRWNKFTTGTWWDKEADADNHTDIFPLSKTVLGADLNLKQNPGYDDIAR